MSGSPENKGGGDLVLGTLKKKKRRPLKGGGFPPRRNARHTTARICVGRQDLCKKKIKAPKHKPKSGVAGQNTLSVCQSGRGKKNQKRQDARSSTRARGEVCGSAR